MAESSNCDIVHAAKWCRCAACTALRANPSSYRPRPSSFQVTDDALDAPDGAVVDGYVRHGDRWTEWFPEESSWVSVVGDPPDQVLEVHFNNGVVRLASGNYAAFNRCEQVARPAHTKHTAQELVNIIKQALPMTMRNESPSEARVALAELERRLAR